MNTILKDVLDAKYARLSFPAVSLSGFGVDTEHLRTLINGGQNYFISMFGDIPVCFHLAVVKLLSIGAFQINVAENDTNVVVEYNAVDDENSAVVIKREVTSGTITNICSYIANGEELYSSEWLAALLVGVSQTSAKTTKMLSDFISLVRNKVTSASLTEVSETEVTEAYYSLLSEFMNIIFELDNGVMFDVGQAISARLKKISKEYVLNTSDFDDLKTTLSIQSFYQLDPNPIYFTLFTPRDEVEVKTEKVMKAAESFDFTITGSRRFDESEQEMMANTAMRMVNYIPTKIAVDMVTAFYATNKCLYGSPLRAAMLYGPSGTGKTEMVQYLGYKLGLPVTTFSCSANTDEYDLLGKPISLGISGGGDGKIVYTETELTKAIKNGWIIEIQEASVVKETAVHQIFNSLFDGTELVQLPDGSMITPHPNFIAVFTTNVNYEGCNAMNQSLISRNQFVAEVKLPTEEETIERLKKQLNWPVAKNDDAVKIAVTCMTKINEFLAEESIDDGSCDFRGVKDWLQMYLAYNEVGFGKSLLELAEYSIIPKSTLDSNYHSDIYAICESIIPE